VADADPGVDCALGVGVLRRRFTGGSRDRAAVVVAPLAPAAEGSDTVVASANGEVFVQGHLGSERIFDPSGGVWARTVEAGWLRGWVVDREASGDRIGAGRGRLWWTWHEAFPDDAIPLASVRITGLYWHPDRVRSGAAPIPQWSADTAFVDGVGLGIAFGRLNSEIALTTIRPRTTGVFRLVGELLPSSGVGHTPAR
jgi:hypothetical protein